MEPDELRKRLTPEVRANIMRENWHSHDARWFLKVGAECGFELANRLNIATIRSMGRTEMKRLWEALGCPAIESAEDFAKLAVLTGETYFSSEMLEEETRAVGVDTFEATITKCFVFEEVKKAGVTGLYECACAHRHEGWLEGCGLTGKVKILQSMMQGAPFCQVVDTSVARKKEDDTAGEEPPD